MSYNLALIGARSGSKGVPGKNVRMLGGHPLLAWAIRAAAHTEGIDRIIVSSDSQAYCDLARHYGAEVPFLQPEKTARDDSGDYPFVKHAIEWIGDHESSYPEKIVLLRPTTPLREPKVIAEIMKVLRYDQMNQYSAVRSVHEMAESAHKCFHVIKMRLQRLDGSYSIDAANRPRQRYPKTYHANGYADVFGVEYVRTHCVLFGGRVRAFITPRTTEVDTEEDLNYLEYEVRKHESLIGRLFS